MISATVDKVAMARINAMLDRLAKESPKKMAAETRRAAIYICQSLKKRTPKAPKKVRKNEYKAEPSTDAPKYIRSQGRLLRRWKLTRKLGTPAEYSRNHYVYTQAHPNKKGKMVGKKPAEEKRELLKHHGGIPRAGLGKKSWGWIMKGIHSSSGGGDLSWKRTRGERRDPRKFVRGLFSTVMGQGAMARITNALDYIRDALPPSAISEAITSAMNRLQHNIDNNIKRITK